MVDILGYILYIFRWWISWVVSSLYLDGGYLGLYPLYMFRWWISGVISIITAGLGLIGNSLSVMVLCSRYILNYINYKLQTINYITINYKP